MSSLRSSVLSITSWNVNGLSENFFMGNKLSNSDFLRFFNHCDIIVLTETWRSDEISLSGYEFSQTPVKNIIERKMADLQVELLLVLELPSRKASN